MTRRFRAPTTLAFLLVFVSVGASAQSVTAPSGNRGTTMTREDFDDAARRGLTLAAALEDGFLGMRAVGSPTTPSCVEYRQVRVMTGCRGVAVYVDGLPVVDPGWFLAFQPVDDIERAEVLSSVEATTRFGSEAGNGALIIQTRSGQAPSRAQGNHITGLDWSLETEPYSWVRVSAITAVANAAGAGLGLLLMRRCLGVDSGWDDQYDCSALSEIGSRMVGPMLPGLTGSFAARWAGSTNRSRGRMQPSVLFGTITSAAGYYLVIDQGLEGTSTSEVLGAVLLTAVTPLVTVVSNRIFRTLR